MKRVVLFLIFISGTKSVYSQTEMSQNLKTQWFTDARFGMFIHFGLYSNPAGVWNGKIMGRNIYAEWIQKQGNWPATRLYTLSGERYHHYFTLFGNRSKYNRGGK